MTQRDGTTRRKKKERVEIVVIDTKYCVRYVMTEKKHIYQG